VGFGGWLGGGGVDDAVDVGVDDLESEAVPGVAGEFDGAAGGEAAVVELSAEGGDADVFAIDGVVEFEGGVFDGAFGGLEAGEGCGESDEGPFGGVVVGDVEVDAAVGVGDEDAGVEVGVVEVDACVEVGLGRGLVAWGSCEGGVEGPSACELEGLDEALGTGREQGAGGFVDVGAGGVDAEVGGGGVEGGVAMEGEGGFGSESGELIEGDAFSGDGDDAGHGFGLEALVVGVEAES
jgi:hypothetical protein